MTKSDTAISLYIFTALRDALDRLRKNDDLTEIAFHAGVAYYHLMEIPWGTHPARDKLQETAGFRLLRGAIPTCAEDPS
jgi:hypothetical protein